MAVALIKKKENNKYNKYQGDPRSSWQECECNHFNPYYPPRRDKNADAISLIRLIRRQK